MYCNCVICNMNRKELGKMSKPILCLDFDGVIHGYQSGWVAHDFIPDPPVPGAFEFIAAALEHFDVVIFSSRSSQDGGIRAMQLWLEYWAKKVLSNEAPNYEANMVINQVVNRAVAWPTDKPAAFVTIDDRAIQFDGTWPSLMELKLFRPWNKSVAAAPKPSAAGKSKYDFT